LSPENARVVSVPTYRWQRERFWYDAGSGGAGAATTRDRSINGPGLAVASAVHAGTFFWDFDLSLDTWPALGDHQLHGAVVIPAAAYITFARTCAAQVLRSASIELTAFR